MANPVVHFEIIGPDPERLRAFYAALFDWNAAPGAPVAPAISGSTEYSFIEPDASWLPPAGGIGGGPEFHNHTIFYVGVDNVEAALQRVADLGGAVVLGPERNEGGQVTVGHFRDPAGNLVGVAGPA